MLTFHISAGEEEPHSKMMFWLAPSCFAATASGLLLAALLTPGSTSTAVYIVLPVIIGMSVLALWLQNLLRSKHRKESDEEDPESNGLFKVELSDAILRTSSVTIVIIMAPSVSFFILLLLRLTVGEDHFDGDASMLDFGPLHGIEGGEPNIAFEKGSFSSFLNSLQGGFAAVCAFPAVSRIFAGLLGGHFRRTILAVTFLCSAVMTLDPSFYIIRYFFEDDESFATSSFVSSSFEWAVGYCLGMSVGFVTTALVQRQMLLYMDTSDKNEIRNAYHPNFDDYGYDPYDRHLGNSRYPSFYESDDEDYPISDEKMSKIEDPRIPCNCLIKTVHVFFGLFMIFTTFATAILFGYTWNTCDGGSTDCVNYSTNEEYATLIGSLLSLIPSAIIGIAAWREKSRSCCSA